MKETDCLYPNFLRMELKQMEGENEAENEALGALSTTIQKFINSTEMNSKVIAAEIECLSAYEDLVSEMVAANYEEIEDNHTLYESIGSEILDGKTIFNEMENVMKYKNICSQREEEYRKLKKECQQKGFSGWEAQYMHWGYLEGKMHFLVEEYQKRYNVLQKKEAQYDEIELRTKTLFQDVAEVRQMIRRAMETFSEPGEYQIKPFINGKTWREEFYDYHRRKLFTVNSEREETINWFNVKQTINKPAKNISNIEYELLAECYLNADTDGMVLILMGGLEKEKYVEFDKENAIWNIKDDCSTEKEDVFKIWKINELKGEKNKKYITQQYQKELKRVKMKDANDVNIKIILQKLSFYNYYVKQGMLFGKKNDDRPWIKITYDKEEELQMQFLKNQSTLKHNNNTQRITYAYGLECYTVSVSKTIKGEDIEHLARDYAERKLIRKLGTYDLGDETINYMVDGWREAVEGAIPIPQIYKEGIKYVFTMFNGAEKKKSDKETINRQFDALDSAEVFNKFDCYVNVIRLESYNYAGWNMIPYEGENTMINIEKINNNISHIEGIEEKYRIDMQKIIDNPDEIAELLNRIIE